MEELALLTAPQVGSLDELARRGEVRIVVLRLGCSYRQRLEEVLARRGIPTRASWSSARWRQSLAAWRPGSA